MKLLLLLALTFVRGEDAKPEMQGRQLLHYGPEIPQPLGPQGSLFSFPPARAPYPQLEQQFLIYPGGAPGQPFLLQPGAPPGNFLIPQPQPGFVLRDAPPRPFFQAGYPKPAHIPSIEKDAEEIPTNPAAIPPFKSQDFRPQKLETFDEKPEFTARPQVFGVKAPGYPKNALPNPPLKPGQRFFILNGQPLFSNYPIQPNFLQYQPSTRFAPQPFYYPQQQEFSKVPPPQVPIQDYFLRNAITGEIANVRQNFQPEIQNFISLNQPEDYKQNSLFKYAPPVENETEAEGKLDPIVVTDAESPEGNETDLDYYRFQPEKVADDDNEAVVIDAKADKDVEKEAQDNESEAVEAQADSPKESSVSQAQPAAIALAGPGGIASAAPRGTALVGDNGLAVSSPQATAVAGPREEDKNNKDKNKQPK